MTTLRQLRDLFALTFRLIAFDPLRMIHIALLNIFTFGQAKEDLRALVLEVQQRYERAHPSDDLG